MSPDADHARDFVDAARAFVDQVRRLPGDVWDRPALGTWSTRTLVGHGGRSISTVIEYAAHEADDVDLPEALDYYRRASERSTPQTRAAIDTRAVVAGAALGLDPAAHLDELLADVEPVLDRAGDWLIATPLGGMPFAEYLRTRTFELVVHGLDLAAATGVPYATPESALRRSVELAAGIAAAHGDGVDLLRSLTGRAPGLPGGRGL